LFSQAIPAQCADIFFAYSSANRLYIDLAFVKKDAADKTNRLTLCGKDRSLLEGQTELLDKKIIGLQMDKSTYKTESDRFEALYVSTDQAKVKAENAAPSRLRWFGAGAVSALAVVMILFILKK
jgi:hypothetical protein